MPMPKPLEWAGQLWNRITAYPEDESDQGNPPAATPAPLVPVPAAPSDSAAVASPTDEQQDIIVKSGDPVEGQFIPAGSAQSTDLLIGDAQKHTERFRRLVETFDEDKQEPLEWLLRQGITVFCYAAPFVLAVFIGMAVGDKFATGQAGWAVAGIHLLSLFLEIAMPILGLVTTIVFRRALRDRASIGPFIGVGLFFLVVSIGNAVALLVVMEQAQTLSLSDLATTTAILVRSFGALILDVACTVYLGIANVRSLRKYIADQRRKIEAVRDVNAVNIELDQTSMRAAIDRVTAISEMRSKQQRMATFDEAERLTQQAVIETMRKKLNSGDDERGGRSRYGSW
jgi:hypothetical protein